MIKVEVRSSGIWNTRHIGSDGKTPLVEELVRLVVDRLGLRPPSDLTDPKELIAFARRVARSAGLQRDDRDGGALGGGTRAYVPRTYEEAQVILQKWYKMAVELPAFSATMRRHAPSVDAILEQCDELVTQVHREVLEATHDLADLRLGFEPSRIDHDDGFPMCCEAHDSDSARDEDVLPPISSWLSYLLKRDLEVRNDDPKRARGRAASDRKQRELRDARRRYLEVKDCEMIALELQELRVLRERARESGSISFRDLDRALVMMETIALLRDRVCTRRAELDTIGRRENVEALRRGREKQYGDSSARAREAEEARELLRQHKTDYPESSMGNRWKYVGSEMGISPRKARSLVNGR